MAGHRYLATACLHQEHPRCRLNCEYCPAACVCPCHRDDAAVVEDPTTMAIRRVVLTQRPPLGAPSTDGAAQATPVQAT